VGIDRSARHARIKWYDARAWSNCEYRSIQCVDLDVKKQRQQYSTLGSRLGRMLIQIGAKQRPEQSKLESDGTRQRLEGSRGHRCGSRTQ